MLHAEAHGGFVEELVGDGPGAFGGAVLGARGRGSGRGTSGLRLGTGAPSSPVSAAAEPVVHAVAPDGVEELVHAGAVEGEELLHGGDAFGVEADFGAGADAG